MSNDGIFTSAVRREAAEEIKFTLDGEDYLFTPPGFSAAILIADNDREFTKASLNWLEKGLREEQRPKLRARLLDIDDPFDLETLDKIVGYLIREASGRPTGPSSD